MAPFSSATLLLPAFCRSPVILRTLVLAQAVAIVLAFAPGAAEEPWLRLGFISLFVQWVVLMTTAMLCIFRVRLNTLSAIRLGITVMLILLLVTSFVSISAHLFLAQTLWLFPVPLGQFLIQNLLLAFIIGLMAIQFFVLHLERQQRMTEQARAELAALQARIQPHFLFNSLNTAAELTQQDPLAAEQALLDLASLFRAAMHAGEACSLEQEITLARKYLALEQWRLGSRLAVDWQMPSTIPDILVPVLTIQPLLENAVRHGIELMPNGGKIDIQIQVHRHAITLLILNPTVDKAARIEGNGIALDNIRQRLSIQFSEQATLSMARIDNQFRVKLVLPLRPS